MSRFSPKAMHQYFQHLIEAVHAKDERQVDLQAGMLEDDLQLVLENPNATDLRPYREARRALDAATRAIHSEDYPRAIECLEQARDGFGVQPVDEVKG